MTGFDMVYKPMVLRSNIIKCFVKFFRIHSPAIYKSDRYINVCFVSLFFSSSIYMLISFAYSLFYYLYVYIYIYRYSYVLQSFTCCLQVLYNDNQISEVDNFLTEVYPMLYKLMQHHGIYL